MEYIVNGYEPKRLFEIFEEISAIPRGSGNEKEIADGNYRISYKNENGDSIVQGYIHVKYSCK